MINTNVKLSPKSDSSKSQEEDDALKLKLLYQNTPHMERDKSSGLTSDEDTTSSSLLPIPDTLRQMRGELKRTISDIGKASDSTFTVCGVLQDSSEGFQNSLAELRNKYTLKNETSVALKMNSANLMLDEMLKSNNLNMTSNEIFPSRFFAGQNYEAKALHETESSSLEDSASSVKNCSHMALAPTVSHNFPQVHCNFSQSLCPSHGPPFQQVCRCASQLIEKGSRVVEENSDENLRKKSITERIPNLHLKYRIQSMYKIMQKTNPFIRDRKKSECIAAQQGIPDTSYREDSLASDETSCKCRPSQYQEQQYPKKMIFDLVESSDISQSDSKSIEKEDRHQTCSTEANCTCLNARVCSCPEVIPKCYCVECTCSPEFISQNQVKDENPRYPSAPERTNEYAPKEAKDALMTQGMAKEFRSALGRPNGNIDGNTLREMVQFSNERKKCKGKARKLVARTDVYYFDHGNSAYYRTTDDHPVRYTECLVERTDEYATRFWAEIFGAIEIGIAFLVSFILQLYRFLFTSIIRSLTVGLLQIFSDYFFKPLLTIIFNGLIQPCLILGYNIATSFRDLCLPISQTFGFFAKEVANIFRSCRLVEVNYDNCRQLPCNCRNKV